MNVRMQYYAQVRQVAGVENETIALDEGADLRGLLARLADRYGDSFRSFVLDVRGDPRPGIIVLVNDRPVGGGESPRLAEGDQVSIFSPVAGG